MVIRGLDRKHRGILAILIIIIIIIIIIMCMLIGKFVFADGGIIYTEKVDAYGKEKYSLPKTVFFEELPEKATIVSFSYYDYWNEAKDIYLELQFESKEEMKTYVESMMDRCTTYSLYSCNESANYVEEKNIYHSQYTDVFCLSHITVEENKAHTGYSIEAETEKSLFRCNFGVISYSYDELTVIQSYTCGWFSKDVHNYVPKYFLRFNVPLDKNNERLFFVDEPKLGTVL